MNEGEEYEDDDFRDDVSFYEGDTFTDMEKNKMLSKELLCIVETYEGLFAAVSCDELSDVLAEGDMIHEAMIDMMTTEDEHRTGFWEWMVMKNGDVVGFSETGERCIWTNEGEEDD